MKQDNDIAKEIISFLDESAARLDTHIVAKLDDARNQAVSVLAAHAQPVSAVGSNHHGITHLFGDYIHHHRALMSAVLVCSAVFIAFLVTQRFSGQDVNEQGDAFLLASELPPEAYLDKGFDAWLEHTSQP